MNAQHFIILLLMLSTLAVLVTGVIGMMRGKDGKASNRLMMLRVALQGITIALLGLMFLMGR